MLLLPALHWRRCFAVLICAGWCQRPGSGLRWWPSRSPHPGVFQWWVPWSSPPVGAGEAAVGAAVMLARCVLGNAGAAAAPGGGAAGWRAESGWGADVGVGEHPGHCGDHNAPAAGAGEAFPGGVGGRVTDQAGLGGGGWGGSVTHGSGLLAGPWPAACGTTRLG